MLNEETKIAESGLKLFDSLLASMEKTRISTKNLPLETVDEQYARRPGVIPKMWTAEEDIVLRDAVERHGEKNWREIAAQVPERNHLQCLQRWKKALKPGIVKGHWSREEDDYLLEVLKSFDPTDWNWAKIAAKIPGRNAKQCRERWFLNLDPSINRGPWTSEEDEKLLSLHKELAGAWSQISKELEGRTENSVKTRFHSLQRHRVRSRGWIPEEDEVFIRGLLVYGRNFVLCSRLLPGRSKGQLKKRYPVLLDIQPDLHTKILNVEQKIASGTKPTPIHEMLRALQKERQQKQNQSQPEKKESSLEEGLEKNDRLKRLSSSWMEEVIGDYAEPTVPVNDGIKRVNSAKVLADILMGDETEYPGQNFDVSPGEIRQRQKGLTTKRNSLAVLDKLLSSLDDFGDVLSGIDVVPMGQVYNKPYSHSMDVEKSRLRRDSDMWMKVFDDDDLENENAFDLSGYHPEESRKNYNTLSSSQWNIMPAYTNYDMPVV